MGDDKVLRNMSVVTGKTVLINEKWLQA